MKTHTSEFKAQIPLHGRELDDIVTFTIGGVTTELGNEDLNSITPHYEGAILKSVMKQLDIDSNTEIPVGTELNYKIGVKTRSGKNLFNYKLFNAFTTSVQFIAITGLKENTNYTLSSNIPSASTTVANLFLSLNQSPSSSNNGVFPNSPRTINTGNNTILYIGYRDNNNNLTDEATSYWYQLEEGSTATTYEGFGAYDYVDYGNYIVKSVEKQEDTNSYKITCYDKMLYAMKDYENSGINYPITIKDYLEAICTKIGLTYEGSQFANSDKIIEKELYLDTEGRSMGYTYRNVLDEISAVAGGTICINTDDEVEVRYIHDVGELNTATGSNIAITDSKEAELSSFELEGKTVQETRSGKNLLKPTNIGTTTNGVTFTINADNSITINGTATADTFFNINYISSTSPNNAFISIESGITYTISTQTSLPANISLTLRYYSPNQNLGTVSMASSKTFTASSNGDAFAYIYVKNGGVMNNLRIYPQVEKSNTMTSYEPYGVMPSPDYPSELVSVGYTNLFVGGGTTTNNSVIFTKNDDGSYNINGTASAQANNYNYVDLVNTGFVDGKTYTFYTNQQLPSGVEILCEGYNGSSWVKHLLLPITNSNQVDTRTIGFGTSTRVRFTLRVGNGTNVNISNLKIMIVEGNKQLSYVPLNKYGIEIKALGNNLFDKNYNIIEGAYISSTNTISTDATLFYQNYYIKVEPNTTYVISSAVSTIYRIAEYKNDYTFIQRYYNANASTNYSFTTSANCQYIKMAGTVLTAKDTLQIEKGSTPTSYKYTANTCQYILDAPLRSIGNVKDLLYIKNNMLYVERHFNSVIFDGGTTNKIVSKSGTTANNLLVTNIIPDIKKVANNSTRGLIISNYFKNEITNNMYSYNVLGVAVRQEGAICFGFGLYSPVNTVNLGNTWLSNNQPEVVYELATPYTEELGAVQTPSTYEGVTYIDAPNTINISYIDEFEEIDEEYLKDVNVNFGEKFGPVNTIILSRGGDGDKIALSIPENLADADKIAIQITDNQIMNGNDRNEYIPDILNQLYGLEYYINDFSSTGICYLDLCDRYRIKIGDTSYKCVMFNDNINRTQGLEENIYTDMPETSEQEYKYIGSTDRGITQANIIANKAEATITEYTQKVDEVNNRLNAVETKQTDTDRTINILSTHIDADGDITEVTTTTGFTFNADGMTIADSQSNFSALHRNDGTYYKDGNTIVGQYTKDGSKQKDLQLFGVYYYGMRDFDDTPMFVAQLYSDSNGEECFGHFYNRGD